MKVSKSSVGDACSQKNSCRHLHSSDFTPTHHLLTKMQARASHNRCAAHQGSLLRAGSKRACQAALKLLIPEKSLLQNDKTHGALQGWPRLQYEMLLMAQLGMCLEHSRREDLHGAIGIIIIILAHVHVFLANMQRSIPQEILLQHGAKRHGSGRENDMRGCQLQTSYSIHASLNRFFTHLCIKHNACAENVVGRDSLQASAADDFSGIEQLLWRMSGLRRLQERADGGPGLVELVRPQALNAPNASGLRRWSSDIHIVMDRHNQLQQAEPLVSRNFVRQRFFLQKGWQKEKTRKSRGEAKWGNQALRVGFFLGAANFPRHVNVPRLL